MGRIPPGSQVAPVLLSNGWACSKTKEKGRETMRLLKGNFPQEQDTDAGSQVAIRQNPSAL